MRATPALLRYAPLGAFVAVSVLLAFSVHRDGHFWGDDFALYIRQSEGLVNGNWAQVISDNHFSVDNSAWHTFSPYVYPWGFPMLLAPFYSQWGLDYEHLKWLGVICFAVFLVCFNRITERRIGYGAALALTVAIGCSLPFLGQTNTVQSEMPFLAFAGISLWLIDRLGERNAWEADRAWPLVALGGVLAFTFNIRREGLALLVALAAVHVVHLVTTRHAPKWWRSVRWKRLTLPYVTFAVSVAVFQLVLPSVLVPDYPGTGFQNLKANVPYFRDELASQLGFSRPYRDHYEVFGSTTLGQTMFRLVLWLILIGFVARLVRNWRQDASLLAYTAAMIGVTGRLPFHEGRYLLQLTPFLLYFAAQALPTLAQLIVAASGRRPTPGEPTDEIELAAELPFADLSDLPDIVVADIGADPDAPEVDAETGAGGQRADERPALLYRVAVGVVIVGLAGIALLGFSATRGEADRTAAGDATGIPQWGPTDPNVEEMWAAVRANTRADDVVAFFRSRAMTLETDRRSIQSGGLATILEAADYYAMEKGSSYSQPNVTDEQAAEAGMVKVWENTKFVLWQIPQ